MASLISMNDRTTVDPMAPAHVVKSPDPIMDQSANVLDHAQQRNKRLRSSVIAGLLLKPLALLTPLLIMPLQVRYLGKEGFGLFQAIVGLAVLLAMSNVGMQQGLVNRLIDCHVSGDRVMARRYISSLAITLGALLGVLFILWTEASILLPWGHIFKVTNGQFAQATPWVAWITGSMFLVGMVLFIPSAVYTAYQEQATAYVWDGVAKLAIVVATIAVVCIPFKLMGVRLVAVALAMTAVPVTISALNTLVLYKNRPWFRPRWADFDLSIVRSVLRDGFYMFILQGAVIIMFQGDDALIGALVSPEAVTPYALVSQVFLMAYGVLWVFLGPLLPAHGEAYRRGDVAWIQRHLRLSLIAGFVLICGCGAVLLVFGKLIFGWVHVEVPRSLIVAMVAVFLLKMWLECRAAILNPINVLKPQMQFFLAHIVLNFVFAVLLVKPFKAVGVAWAMPISGLLTTAWGYPMLLRRALKQRAAAISVSTAS
jgi:O-antigen/teichoic acid export membrane protein